MIFNSYIFMLFYLPLSIVGYFTLNRWKKYRLGIGFLLIMSLWFYGYLNPIYLVILSISIIINYLVYSLLQRKSFYEKVRLRKVILCIGILINLLILFYFKYYNFFVDSLNLVFRTSLTIKNILLPLGISFITFQQIAFIVDTYRKEVPKYSLLYYALFIAFFPRLSSGPIVMHNELLPFFDDKERKKVNWNCLSSGIYLFVMGLGKKVLIADVFGRAADWGYSNIAGLNTTSAIFVSLAYTIQIYFDFSGYSDMAVGISKMFNLELPINFNSPYKADTIIDFWSRWHMTLTRFLRKYLYFPLGGNRRGQARTYLNTIIVFLCSGLWHGANWTFVLWGLIHGCFLIFTKKFIKEFNRVPRIINKIITLSFVNFTWILFRAGSFSTYKQMMKAIFQNNWGSINVPNWRNLLIVLCGIGFILFGCKNAYEKAEEMKYNVLTVVFTVVIGVVCVFCFAGKSTFIYAGF